ncbi:type II toxin-antitoxin system PemK/MazF family toxin [Anaeromicropila populeti]|uniref:mRNA interferase n=1 Tax=Anaeromicropila populeti TaxID=37658 RepID=A0A1I6HMW6_9FIRM|nr:type II toxin-antitoxin system PemK/MazF family toxin [Anaeromicropila populeti]SFR55823.1 mRNA-degrading endonuclease, toxin component of the MazEF toxin-antitoxin module [Anaeromicropila populeti]
MLDNIKRGDIVYANFGNYNRGSRQAGIRPACIISNNKANQHSPVITLIPLTSKNKKKELPTHVSVSVNDATGLTTDSVALTEQIISVDKRDIKKVVGEITNNYILQAITKGIQIQVGVFSKYN